MYANDFEYDNEKLSDYGMIICSFDGNGNLETVSSGSDITFNQFKPSGSNNFHIYSFVYETSFTATFQICKNPCLFHSQEEMVITPLELSSLQRWLNKKKYGKFKILQDDYEDIYWNCTFVCKQINLSGRCVGLELTMTTDAPYAYKDDIYLEFDASSNLNFSIYDVSDEIGFINPIITIKLLNSGNLTIKNSMDTLYTKIDNCLYLEEIKLDCKNKIITSSTSSHDFCKDFNFIFPKIFNTYDGNKNDFTLSLPCLITVTYSPIIKVGI